ncbi:hypothetical protein EVAR_85837_1 [Eumeta japonica]|uniref:Uncharacterized protein n=1 Tax=Eumeta variegata TaxID=151549 RepID=A0A4C1UQB7_EUMVA|nr:hypothetical protein EVAR_85837_1 [Eumeta japonica]
MRRDIVRRALRRKAAAVYQEESYRSEEFDDPGQLLNYNHDNNLSYLPTYARRWTVVRKRTQTAVSLTRRNHQVAEKLSGSGAAYKTGSRGDRNSRSTTRAGVERPHRIRRSRRPQTNTI